MEEYVYYNDLYDLYSELLTDKQKLYFEDYYFSNLSLAEIASNYNVSRNAVYKQIRITVDKLNEYEEKLHLYEKRIKVLEILNSSKYSYLKEELEKYF